MKKSIMKKVLVLLLAMVLVFVMTACGNGGGDADGAAGDNPFVGSPDEVYYMVTFLAGIDYWVTCFEGMQDAAALFGVSVEYTGATTTDVAEQVQVLESVIAMQPAGIALTAVNAEALREPIDRAIAEGIAVIMFDSDSPESNRPAYLSTGNFAAGEVAAEYLLGLIDGQGTVALLYTIGQENSESRVEGFKSWSAQHAPDLEFALVNTAGDTIAATNNLAAALQADENIVAVFCVDGIAGTAGPVAVQESGRGDEIRVLAFDVDSAVLDKVADGTIEATVAQGQYNMGFWSMVFLFFEVHGLSGDALPSFVDTGITIVTQENVDQFYVDN